MATPMKYESLIGDMGTTLSGGQRQRVLPARALYHKPKVFFMDEGTAHLDAETEKKIADMLNTLDITRIVVAHRMSLVAAADRVVTLDQGSLLEPKTPELLLN
jgi:ATP-binding cassette subfamily B protein RaxB